MHAICRSWYELDNVIAPHVTTLSGGIFLYEQQATKILELLHAIVERRGLTTVCETGFNAGHSALLFLSVPNTSVGKCSGNRAALHCYPAN